MADLCIRDYGLVRYGWSGGQVLRGSGAGARSGLVAHGVGARLHERSQRSMAGDRSERVMGMVGRILFVPCCVVIAGDK